MLTGSSPRILDNLTTAVLTFDADLRLTSINPAGEMLFEISAKKAVGQRLAELLPHARLAMKTLSQTLESRHPITARGVPLKLPGHRGTSDVSRLSISAAVQRVHQRWLSFAHMYL